MSQTNSESDKKNKFFTFQCIFSTFSTNFVDWNVKKVNNKKICCPVGFSKELNAVFKVKMSKINTENDKKPKNFQFPKFLCILSKFLSDYVDWNSEKDQQGKTLLSSRLF